VGTLLGLLHTAVIDRYGQDAWYLEEVVENPISLKLSDIRRIGSWDWETDGLSTAIESIYTVTANRTAIGRAEEVEVHLAFPGDNSVRWLTDCGDPLPKGGCPVPSGAMPMRAFADDTPGLDRCLRRC
jgi:hypothetical protein